ncbi:MAG: hypothetical protein LUD15_10610 [Bacteroides sp.]|nr:hypothetical protein [Bacteroides sp.]
MGVPQENEVVVFRGFAKDKIPRDVVVQNVTVLGSNQQISWDYGDEGLRVTTPILAGYHAVVFKIECE